MKEKTETKPLIAWVTGASSGLGLSTARALKRGGFRVVAGARSFRANEGDGDCGYRMYLDVTDDASVREFAQKAYERFGCPDVLVNCAGILILGSCEGYSTQEIRSVMDTDFLGQARMISAVLPLMRGQKRGRIVNYSSINGLLGIPFQGAYTAAKHAVEGYSESLAMEVRPFGIEVMLVEPGDHRSGSAAYRRHSASESGNESPYQTNFASACRIIDHDEKNGSDPDALGDKVAKTLRKKHLPLRLRVAMPDQRLAVLLHKFLPPRQFSKIIASYYKTNEND